MKNFEWPNIKRSDRAAFLGPSGSGKTELVKALLRTQRNFIAVDTKRTEDWSMVSNVEPLDEKTIFRVRSGRYVYRVSEQFLVDEAGPERFFRWALRAGNRVIYIDEQLDILPTPGEKILATQGRANGAGLWVATQRPFGIPLYTISEVQHTFVFALRLKRDRERVEESVAGADIPWDSLNKNRYSFVYIDGRGKVSGPARLKI